MKPSHLMLALLLPLTAQAAPVTLLEVDMSEGAGAFNSVFVSFTDDDSNLGIDTLGGDVGGNPGSYLEVLHFYDPVEAPDGNPDGYTVQSFHDYTLFSYDPQVSGPITALNFAIDVETTRAITVYFSVAQGDFSYAAGFTDLFPADSYQTVAAFDLTEADFSGVDFIAGGPITFGFGMISRADGFGEDAFAGDQFSARFDNFSVSVDVAAVPLPAGIWLMGSALGALGLARRRS